MVKASHAREFIFLKTRKTAGTSIEMALEPWCRPPGAVVVEQTPALILKTGIVGRRLLRQLKLDRRPRRTDWTNHMTAAAVCKALGRGKWDRYRKITTVRNPFDLLVSRFHFNQSNLGKIGDGDFAQTRAALNAAGRFFAACRHARLAGPRVVSGTGRQQVASVRPEPHALGGVEVTNLAEPIWPRRKLEERHAAIPHW